MSTLTYLEDGLRMSSSEPEQWLHQLIAAKIRLQQAMHKPISTEQYQQFTVLLEAVIQAEDILNSIYFRYHNHPLDDSELSWKEINT